LPKNLQPCPLPRHCYSNSYSVTGLQEDTSNRLTVQWQQNHRTRYSSPNPQSLIQYQAALPPLASWPTFPTRRHSGVNSPYHITSLGHPQLASPNQQHPIMPSSGEPAKPSLTQSFHHARRKFKTCFSLGTSQLCREQMSTQGD
jgi:hypothetical protein